MRRRRSVRSVSSVIAAPVALAPALLLGLLLFASSCSDPALPAAQGAAALRWEISTSGTKHPACVPGPHWSNIPASPNDEQYVSASQIAGKVENGVSGAVV